MTDQEWALHRQVMDAQAEADNYREIATYYEATLQAIVRADDIRVMVRIASGALEKYKKALNKTKAKE